MISPNWKVLIPHTWDPDRQAWADAHIVPDDPAYDGDALWVTIDCYDEAEQPREEGTEEWRAQAAHHLRDREFWVCSGHPDMGDTDMVVRATDFSKDEFLHWLKVWVREKGMPIAGIRLAPASEFAGRSAVADFVLSLQEQAAAERKEDESD